MEEKKVIFFDLFDTLVTADRGELEPFFTREVDRMGDNGRLPDAISTIHELSKEAPEMLEGTTAEKLAQYYEDRMAMLISNVRPDVLEMLQDLKNEGWQLCVISDAARVDIAHWSESPLAQYFDNTVFSCDVGYVKPDPRLYEIAKQSMGDPSQCIFIGDGGHDELLGAHRAGMVTIKAEYIKNRRDESIVRESDIRATNARKVAELARGIDFTRHPQNYDSPFHSAVREMIEVGDHVHTSKEATEQMVAFYDSLKLAAHQLGVGLGLPAEGVEQLTNDILGKTANTTMLDYVREQINVFYEQGGEQWKERAEQLIIDMNDALHTGVDPITPIHELSHADLNRNLRVIEPLVEAIGIDMQTQDICQIIMQDEPTTPDMDGPEDFSQADNL